VLGVFLRLALDGDVIRIYGDGSQVRDFLHVDDVVAAIGSYNATFTAEKYYTESAIATYDTDAIQAVKRMFDDDFAQCREVTLKDLGHPSKPTKSDSM
jgi:dTDP-D-glucose 4,6-dehydratase